MNKTDIRNHLKNVVGYTTKRKIIVIESDDWGSIRTRSKDDYEALLKEGLELNKNSYTMYDALESNTDLERLFDVLDSYKDKNGKNPVFTPMYIMANPDFIKIEADNFKQYHFEHFRETCKSYPNHDNVENLILQGVNSKLFVPALHAREHLNAPRWLRLLQAGHPGLLASFKRKSMGGSWYKGKEIPTHIAGLDPQFSEDMEYVRESLSDAVKMFTETFGYQPEHFIEPDAYGTIEIEEVLHKLGVKFLLRAKFTAYSNYNDTKTKEYFHWIGKRNKWGQIYLTRNCTFEPHTDYKLDWVGQCLKEIETAFLWKKPAVLISHRASYIGSISERNQVNGLTKLNALLGAIVKRWPDVEFMTSMELGRLIEFKN